MNLYLPHDLRAQIKIKAKRERKPQAAVVRDLLAKSIEQEEHPNAGEALLRIAQKAVKGAPADFSQNLDSYLYDPSYETRHH